MLDVVLDFETYWDKDYSLSRMPSAAYVLDARFKAHGAAVLAPDCENGEATWVTGDDLPALFAELDRLRPVRLISHNVKFDASIASWLYGFTADSYVDTMGMSRALFGNENKHSLAAVAGRLGVPVKTHAAVLNDTRGKRDLSPAEERAMATYAMEDARATMEVFRRLRGQFPEGEYAVMDWTIRAFVLPSLRLDVEMLEEIDRTETQLREDLVAKLGVTHTDLRSVKRFGALLSGLGVTPPSSFRKHDPDFLALSEDPDPRVRALVDARLLCASSIVVTRPRSYAAIGRLTEERLWPVDLNYAGAANTHRFSGGKGGGANPQNIPRGSPIKRAILAPKGGAVIVADSSNIELRVSAGVVGQTDILESLRNKVDLYCSFASRLYGREIVKADKDERQVGKVAVLQLGYGAGAATFQSSMWAQSRRVVPTDEAQRVVRLYRTTYPRYPVAWRLLNSYVSAMCEGRGSSFDGGWCGAPLQWLDDGVYLEPSGLVIKYPDLRMEESGEYTYVDVRKSESRAKIYGGKVLENICQALAREIMVWQMLEIDRRLGDVASVALQVHDELVLSVHRAADAEPAAETVKAVMSSSPPWWPDLPLACEIGVGERYGDAKS